MIVGTGQGQRAQSTFGQPVVNTLQRGRERDVLSVGVDLEMLSCIGAEPRRIIDGVARRVLQGSAIQSDGPGSADWLGA